MVFVILSLAVLISGVFGVQSLRVGAERGGETPNGPALKLFERLATNCIGWLVLLLMVSAVAGLQLWFVLALIRELTHSPSGRGAELEALQDMAYVGLVFSGLAIVGLFMSLRRMREKDG